MHLVTPNHSIRMIQRSTNSSFGFEISAVLVSIPAHHSNELRNLLATAFWRETNQTHKLWSSFPRNLYRHGCQKWVCNLYLFIIDFQ